MPKTIYRTISANECIVREFEDVNEEMQLYRSVADFANDSMRRNIDRLRLLLKNKDTPHAEEPT